MTFLATRPTHSSTTTGGDSRPRRGSVQGWEELCDQWTAREAGCRQDGASANAEILELIQQLRVVGAANAAAADGGVGAAAYAARDSHQAASGHMLIETASDGLLYLPADTPHNA